MVSRPVGKAHVPIHTCKLNDMQAGVFNLFTIHLFMHAHSQNLSEFSLAVAFVFYGHEIAPLLYLHSLLK